MIRAHNRQQLWNSETSSGLSPVWDAELTHRCVGDNCLLDGYIGPLNGLAGIVVRRTPRLLVKGVLLRPRVERSIRWACGHSWGPSQFGTGTTPVSSSLQGPNVAPSLEGGHVNARRGALSIDLTQMDACGQRRSTRTRRLWNCPRLAVKRRLWTPSAPR